MTTEYTKPQRDAAFARLDAGHLGEYGIVDNWLRNAMLLNHPNEPLLLLGSAEQGHGPWFECILFRQGFSDFVVTDYNPITYEFRGPAWLHPKQLGSSKNHFRTIISISSIEHSGLGRYGEDLDPDGDLRAMEFCHDLLTPDGLFFLAVPLGLDKIHAPWHRIYGRERLPKLLQGWTMIDSHGFEDQLLDRDTGFGWKSDVHLEYPEYSPVLVLRRS